jgi:hypothetical protein
MVYYEGVMQQITKFKNLITAALLALALVFSSSPSLDAATIGGRSSGGSSSSSGGRSSSSTPKSSPSPSWGSSSKSTPSAPSSGSSWGSSSKSTPPATIPKTSTDSALSQKKSANSSNSSSFGSFNDTKVASQKTYSNPTSKFSSEPASRPEYIPPTYRNGNTSYNIVYNRGYGGYGYYDALGTFILYDALTDRSNHVIYHNGPTTVREATDAEEFFSWFFGIIFAALIIFVVFYFVFRKESN